MGRDSFQDRLNKIDTKMGAGNTVAKCLADRTGGLYVSTETVDELADALRVTLGCALIGKASSR